MLDPMRFVDGVPTRLYRLIGKALEPSRDCQESERVYSQIDAKPTDVSAPRAGRMVVAAPLQMGLRTGQVAEKKNETPSIQSARCLAIGSLTRSATAAY
jgi:hypothetical protein